MSKIVEIDGNDGTGKTTLVNNLRELKPEWEIRDRGRMTEATDDPSVEPEEGVEYVLLDLNTSECQYRLLQAGKSLDEEYHTLDDLKHYKQRFLEVAKRFDAHVIEHPRNLATFRVLNRLVDRDFKVGLPKGHLDVVEQNLGVSFPGRRLRNGAFYSLRVADIIQLVSYGRLDAGFVGYDYIEECKHDGYEIIEHTGWRPFTMVVAKPKDQDIPTDRPIVVATSYPNIASSYFEDTPHCILNSKGSVETLAPEFADVVVDICDTGRTLEANDMEVVDEIMTDGVVYIAKEDCPLTRSILYDIDH